MNHQYARLLEQTGVEVSDQLVLQPIQFFIFDRNLKVGAGEVALRLEAALDRVHLLVPLHQLFLLLPLHSNLYLVLRVEG